MEPTTLRFSQNTLDELAADAEAYGFSNRSEYVRWLVRNRSAIHEHTEDTSNTGPNTDETRHRLESLEARVDALEDEVGRLANEQGRGERRSMEDDALVAEQKKSLSGQTEGDLSDEFPDHVDGDEAAAAVQAARDYIDEHGGASMSEIVLNVMPDHPLGYDVDSDRERIRDDSKRNRSTWWRKVVKPGLKSIEDVQPPVPGGSQWQISDK